MSDTQQEKSPMETFGELKVMLNDYARQETVGPLKLLGKWVAFGLGGALAVAIGLGYLAFALLRALQGIDRFEGSGGSWAPYLIAFAGLVLCVGGAAWAMSRTFSDDET